MIEKVLVGNETVLEALHRRLRTFATRLCSMWPASSLTDGSYDVHQSFQTPQVRNRHWPRQVFTSLYHECG